MTIVTQTQTQDAAFLPSPEAAYVNEYSHFLHANTTKTQTISLLKKKKRLD